MTGVLDKQGDPMSRIKCKRNAYIACFCILERLMSRTHMSILHVTVIAIFPVTLKRPMAHLNFL